MPADFAELWRVLGHNFRLGAGSLHGPHHWRNVERHALSLAEETGADVVVVRLFAVFHDAERENESTDPLHGQRAARLVERMHGDLFTLEERQLEALKYACAFHHRGLTSHDPTIGTCWDADRLDLPRVGIPPAAEFMSTAAGKLRTGVAARG